MSKKNISMFKSLLFTSPQLKSYAIVDSLRDEKLKEKLLFFGLKYVSLWDNRLLENQNQTPLYLVELKKGNGLIDYLFKNNTKGIATYFISPFCLNELQSFYRSLTYPKIEIDEDIYKRGIFGFYDPNILENYIQTLYTEEKINEFFFCIAVWFVPSIETNEELYLVYKNKKGEIEDVNFVLKTEIKENLPKLDFDNISIPDLANVQSVVKEWSIDHSQIIIFNNIEKSKFITQVFRESEKEGYTFLSKEKNRDQAYKLFDHGKELGFATEAELYRFILLGLTLTKPINTFKFYSDIVNAKDKETKMAIMDENLRSKRVR